MSYEEDYEKARLLLRDITMAPVEAKHPRASSLFAAVLVYGIFFLAVAVVAGALGWWCWAVWPDVLGNLWPFFD